MKKTTVVNIKCGEEFDVYIGRANGRLRLPESPFHNPFVIGRDGDRHAVVQKYREYLASKPELIARAKRELRGKRLGCFCHPAECHGDVLAEVADSE